MSRSSEKFSGVPKNLVEYPIIIASIGYPKTLEALTPEQIEQFLV